MEAGKIRMQERYMKAIKIWMQVRYRSRKDAKTGKMRKLKRYGSRKGIKARKIRKQERLCKQKGMNVGKITTQEQHRSRENAGVKS